jgi:excisionase family DNA binding protein
VGRPAVTERDVDLRTVSETLVALRISKPTLYRLLAAGELVAVKIGRRTFIEREELARFVARHRTSRGSP